MISRLYGELHHVHQTFIEHSELRPIFFDDHPLKPTDKEYMQARSVAEMYLDIFEHIFILHPFAPKHLRHPLVAYIQDMCSNSHFLRDYLIENQDLLHPAELLELVKSTIPPSLLGGQEYRGQTAHNTRAGADG